MPKNQVQVAILLLGKEYDCKETRQVMECLVSKDEEKMKTMTSDPIRLTIPILQKFSENVREINKLYGETEKKREEYR